jgi:hypothetical protein
MSGYNTLNAGLHNVGNYTISGIPYVTASMSAPSASAGAVPLELIFPSVTQMIKVHNNDSNYGLRVGFSANGVKGSNYWLVEPHTNSGKNNDYVELRVRTDRIFLLSHDATNVCSGSYVAAELTGISGYKLTDSYSGSAGIG